MPKEVLSTGSVVADAMSGVSEVHLESDNTIRFRYPDGVVQSKMGAEQTGFILSLLSEAGVQVHAEPETMKRLFGEMIESDNLGEIGIENLGACDGE